VVINIRLAEHRRPLGALALLLPLGCLVACGPSITAPDVVGTRLDSAHRAFEKLDVDQFEDVDVVGDNRTAFRDHNWVVLKQVPPAGTKDVDAGETIRLEIGAVDDKGIADRVPEESSVGIEFAEARAEQAREDAEEREQAEKEASEKAEEESEQAAQDEAEAAEAAKADQEKADKRAARKQKQKAVETEESAAAAACESRTTNAGELYTYETFGSDDEPVANRFGGGWIWSFGSHECITTVDFLLRINAPSPGYCTQVGRVADNPGYDVDQRPPSRLNNVIGQAGDC
jgi:hypothetical protein